MIHMKRVYDPPQKSDGLRVLVDKLWPRGLTKDKARVDLWRKDVAPSDALRKNFGHNVEKWPLFQSIYEEELNHKPDALRELKALEKTNKTVTLLYAAKDVEHNNAVVLLKKLQAKGGRS